MQTDVIPSVKRLPDFAQDAARFFLDEAHAAITARGFFRVSLSGGNTPKPMHAALAKLGADLPWNRVQVTFGDERCVPPDDAASNYRMARETLLDLVPIPAGNVFRMKGEIDPETAAKEYEAELAAVAKRCGEERYRHDLLILGLGEDGHTASLFPGTPQLLEMTRDVIPCTGPKPPPQRITMTYPLINTSRHVAFLVNDASKQPIIDQILAGTADYPAGRVKPVDGKITWLLGH